MAFDFVVAGCYLECASVRKINLYGFALVGSAVSEPQAAEDEFGSLTDNGDEFVGQSKSCSGTVGFRSDEGELYRPESLWSPLC